MSMTLLNLDNNIVPCHDRINACTKILRIPSRMFVDLHRGIPFRLRVIEPLIQFKREMREAATSTE